MSDDSSSTSTPTEGGSSTTGPTTGTTRTTVTTEAPAGSDAPPSNEQDGPEDDLSKSKRQANHWQAEARKAAKERAAAQAELEALRLSQKSEHEQAIEKARREGSDEATSVWRAKFEQASRRTEALRVMSAAGVAAPDLVMPHLNLDDIEVNEDGRVDTSAIEANLQTVLERYPMLASPGTPSIHHADLGPKKSAPRGNDPSALLREALGGNRRRR